MSMNIKSHLVRSLAAALIAAALPAVSQAFDIVTVDLEGATSFASVNNFYNGGTDSAGAAGANNYGVSFAASLLALQNDGLGGGTNGAYFSNAPTPGTVMFASGPQDVATTPAFMNIAASTFSLSFYYSAEQATVVNVYSGLNGVGLLGSINLAANATTGCTDSAFCNFGVATWAPGSVAIRSVDFSASAGLVAYDNITVSPVPEPSSLALSALGLAALSFVVRRRRAAK
jgi:PEP-CTERM motif